jgi:hypothetical protein
MRRASRFYPVVLAGVLLAAAVFPSGCAPPDDGTRGPAVERSGDYGALHYRLRSQIEPVRVTLGDRAVWRLTAELTGAGRPGILLRDSAHSSLEIVPLKPSSAFRREGGTRWLASFGVRGYDIGRVPLPRVRLSASAAGTVDTLEFPPDTLYVDSLTPAMTGSVEPDRGPVPTELRPADYVVAIAGALLAIAAIVAAVWLYRRAKRRSRITGVAAPAPEPPEVEFLRSIESLRTEIGSLPRDRFYDRLSLAIRVYVTAVTGVPALDRTTGELERELLARGHSAEAVGAIGGMLRRSDLAKFARHEDPPAEAREALDGAAALAGRLLARADEPLPASAPPGTTG